MFDRVDRRGSPRWTAVKNEATLELQTAAGARRVKVRLVDVNREGALLATDEVSPPAGLFWIRMESPARTDWVGAIPIRFEPSRQLAVRFTRPCGDDFLLAAMLGLDFGPILLPDGQPQSFDDFPALSSV